MNTQFTAIFDILQKNNITCHYASDEKTARDIAIKLVPPNSSVAFARSQTIIDVGLRNYFLERKDQFKLIDPYEKGISLEQSYERRRQSLLADVLLTGSNAITKNGEIVNMDSQGNRVSGIGFGPKKAILVVGTNKIVKDLNEARKRIMTIAAPLNSKRLKQGNPCEITGVCSNCRLPTRICRIFNVINGQTTKDRLHVIFVNKTLGF